MSKDNIIYIECPTNFEPNSKTNAIFLGGGISGCPDWQSVAREKLHQKCPNLVLINPRRSSFDITDKTIAKEQIKWEFECLRKVNAILFWFPKETVCPITLYELGAWTLLSKKN